MRDYNDNKDGEKKREHKRRRYPKKNKKEGPTNQEDIKDDVDSDGFEIVGSKEEKKQKYRDEHRGEFVPRRGRGKWRKNKYWNRKDHENEKKEENEKNEEEAEEKEEKVSLGREFAGLALYLLILVAGVFLINHFVVQRTVVSGSSMNLTLYDGDNLIVDKLSYRFSDPDRFDIVIFPYMYEEDTYYIKRIIGLPGEVVRIDSAGTIYINGEVLTESYGTETILNAGLAENEILLGPDEYFVLGDNRNNSTDSRYESVGNVEGDDIVGKANWYRYR